MKNIIKKYRSSRIIKSIINRILLVQLICIILIIALTEIYLRPLLKQQSIGVAGDMNAYMANVMDTVFKSIDSFSQHVSMSKELYHAILQYNKDESAKSYHSVRLVLNELISSQSYIHDILLETSDQTRFNTLINVGNLVTEALNEDWYHALTQSEYGQDFRILQYPDQDMKIILFAKNILIWAEKYTITFVYNATPILDILEEYSKNIFSGFVLTDIDDTVVYANGETDTIDTTASTGIQGMVETNKGFFFVNSILKSMWKIISFADGSTINLMFRRYIYNTIFIFLSLSVMTVLMLLPLLYKRIIPIHTLSNSIKQVSQNGLSYAPEIHSDDEIGDLSRMFNQMIDSLSSYIDKTISHEKNEQKMKYSLLISQIDPHFIYNTMSIINALARDSRIDDVIEINTALILILQDRLRVNAIEYLDTVRHEIEIVNQYLLIQRHRYENHVDIVWQIDDNLLELQIPKNIIQPLVENALFHGLVDKLTGSIEGEIHIQICSEDNHFILRVFDNGRGIGAEQIEQILKGFSGNGKDRGRHIGLRNINERIKYLYGDDCMMQITGENGTTVTIAINLRLLS